MQGFLALVNLCLLGMKRWSKVSRHGEFNILFSCLQVSLATSLLGQCMPALAGMVACVEQAKAAGVVQIKASPFGSAMLFQGTVRVRPAQPARSVAGVLHQGGFSTGYREVPPT